MANYWFFPMAHWKKKYTRSERHCLLEQRIRFSCPINKVPFVASTMFVVSTTVIFGATCNVVGAATSLFVSVQAKYSPIVKKGLRLITEKKKSRWAKFSRSLMSYLSLLLAILVVSEHRAKNTITVNLHSILILEENEYITHHLGKFYFTSLHFT